MTRPPRPTHKPREIVIHSMAEYIGTPQGVFSAADFLRREGLLPHALVFPNGNVEVLLEDTRLGAHVRLMNTGRLGVEVLLPGTIRQGDLRTFYQRIHESGWVTTEALDSVTRWTFERMARWSIPVDRVKRHSDLEPDRKQDPGRGFPWQRFIGDLQARLLEDGRL